MEKLKLYNATLKEILIYIRKIGPERRTGNAFEKKIRDASICYENFNKNLQGIPKDNLVNYELSTIIETTNKYYNKILEYNSNSKKNFDVKMSSKFDIKVAMNLIPIMNNTEQTIIQIIDSILFYKSMIDDDSQKHLIDFVIKVRLNTSAKLRLKVNYPDVDSLIEDMRKHLLTRKSDTALQAKLMRSRQGHKSIKDFGKELEELFVDLTISQANGDNNKYDILKSINEKNAIRQFADGLRNPKLSTIITARNYTSLKDAIRSAEDEEINKFENNSEIMTFSRRGRGYNFQNRSKNFSLNKNNFQNLNYQKYKNNYNNRGSRGQNSFRNNFNRHATPRNATPSKTYANRSINYAEIGQGHKAQSSTNENNELNYFFRDE